MARPLLALTALGAGLGFVAPSVGRGVAPRSQALGSAPGALGPLDGGWAPLGNSERKVWEAKAMVWKELVFKFRVRG